MKVINGVEYGKFLGNVGANGYSTNRLHNPDNLNALLAELMWGNIRVVRDDFEGDTINLDRWVVTGDTGTTSFAVLANGGGVITADTSTDDNEFVSIKGPVELLGDKNAGVCFRFKVDSVANLCLELGLVDALSDDTLPAINDIDTPTITNGAVNVAVLAMDTDQTLAAGSKWVFDGDSTYATSGSETGVNLAADTWYKVIIQLETNAVHCWLFNDDTPSAPVLLDTYFAPAVIEGGTAVQPWFACGNRAGSAAKVPTIDYIVYWTDR